MQQYNLHHAVFLKSSIKPALAVELESSGNNNKRTRYTTIASVKRTNYKTKTRPQNLSFVNSLSEMNSLLEAKP